MQTDEICQRCGARNSKVTIFQSGELVCQNCGLVYEERLIDEAYEKRSFSNENGGNKNQSRVSGPMKLSEGSSCGSNMVIQSGGQKIRTNTTSNVKTPLERGYDEIQNVLSKKEIPDSLISETKNIFKQVTKSKKMKGRNLKCMIGAMYFIASRRQQVSRSFRDIAKILGLDEKKIKKAFNYIKNVVVNSSTPEQLNKAVADYIKLFCDDNKDHTQLRIIATDISKKINDSCVLEGRNTRTIAGLSLLIGSKLTKTNITKKMICDDFATEATLEKVLDKIKPSLEKLVPSEYASKVNLITK